VTPFANRSSARF